MVRLNRPAIRVPDGRGNRRAESMTILIVDDYPDALDMLAFSLESDGFLVELAIDGAQATRSLLSEPTRYSGLVTDIMLPGSVDGGRVASVARCLRPTMPIVVISGLPTSLMPFFDRHCDYHVLQKPFSLSRLSGFFKTPLAPRAGRAPDGRSSNPRAPRA